MNRAILKASVARFAEEVDRLREEACRLQRSGWQSSVPVRRGELYGVVAEALRGEIIKATKFEGEMGDLMTYSLGGDEEPTCDADGHTVMAGSYTGFGSSYMVEVRILEGTSKENTVAMLRKMANWLERDWARLTDTERYEPEDRPGEEFCPPDPNMPF